MAALCKCGDIQQQHRYGEQECRTVSCGCTRYSPDVAPPAEESTSVRLRRVEGERDEALRRAADLERGYAEDVQLLVGERDELVSAKLALKAELASARTELDAVRTARDNLERELGEARGRIAELEAS